eukprot:1260749-Rhodomonas_salina.1
MVALPPFVSAGLPAIYGSIAAIFGSITCRPAHEGLDAVDRARTPSCGHIAAVYGCNAAIYGGIAAIYGGIAAIYGGIAAIYGGIAAIYGGIAAIYGGIAAIYGSIAAIFGSITCGVAHVGLDAVDRALGRTLHEREHLLVHRTCQPWPHTLAQYRTC